MFLTLKPFLCLSIGIIECNIAFHSPEMTVTDNHNLCRSSLFLTNRTAFPGHDTDSFMVIVAGQGYSNLDKI